MKTVGVVGLGNMGGPMSANLMKAGFAVLGCDIDPARTAALVEGGGASAGSPREVAERADVVLTSLPSIAAFDEVMAGADGLRSAQRSGLPVIETSTMPVEVKERARDLLGEVGTILLDCTLSGTGAQAVTGDLVVYASGDTDAVQSCADVFEGFARAWHDVGPFGAGSKVKFIANLLVSIHNVAAAEAIVLATRAGLDPAMVFDVISSGAGTSRMFEVRGPMMVNHTYDKGIRSIVFQKDLDVIEAFARSLHCPVPMFTASLPIYAANLAQGHQDLDTAAVHAVLEQLAGISPERD